MRPGDMLLCYLVEQSAWVAALKVAGLAYWSNEPPIWPGNQFPVRIDVEVVVELPPEHAVSARQLIDALPRLRLANAKNPGSWGGFVRGAPRVWPEDEARTVLAALRQAQKLACDLGRES